MSFCDSKVIVKKVYAIVNKKFLKPKYKQLNFSANQPPALMIRMGQIRYMPCYILQSADRVQRVAASGSVRLYFVVYLSLSTSLNSI